MLNAWEPFTSVLLLTPPSSSMTPKSIPSFYLEGHRGEVNWKQLQKFILWWLRKPGIEPRSTWHQSRKFFLPQELRKLKSIFWNTKFFFLKMLCFPWKLKMCSSSSHSIEVFHRKLFLRPLAFSFLIMLRFNFIYNLGIKLKKRKFTIISYKAVYTGRTLS